jgi:hypothetical protein
MKTRIAKLSNNEFVAEYWVPHFLWGGHWEGIQELEGAFYSFQSPNNILKYCIQPTQEKAEELLAAFVRHKQRCKDLTE